MRPTKYNKGKKPPAFISHLYKLLQDPSNYQYIKWRQDQQSFIILNIPKFSEIVLPKYYKHSNYSSFVRQLNMYSFSKGRSELEGEHIFKNQLFCKDGEQNLRSIKRRQVTNNNKNSNTILSLAHALNNQIQQENPLPNMQIDIIDSCSQNNQQMIQMAAPTPQHSFFADFPNIQNLKLFPFVSQYLEQTDKIPPTISLKPQKVYFPLKNKIDEMKSNQNQLQQVCISLYEQNEFLTSENKRLQQKLKNEFKRKQQILTQIIKYVINFLCEWNSNSSEVDEQKDFHHRQNVFSDQDSSSDVVLDSYDMLGKRKFQNKDFNSKKQPRPQNKQNGFTFSKYAQNQKKILLTLLKQIEKSYSEKFFFTNNGFEAGSSSHQFQGKTPKDFPYQQKNSSNPSPNNFLMSMLLEFIQSNNLAEVIKRFSLLINLERNKKSKNFTVVNCMKDLKQHFKLKQFQKYQNDPFFRRNLQKSINCQKIEPSNFESFADKQKYLENQKQTIKEMEKQLALIINPKTKSKELKFLEKELFESSQNQSSCINFIPENFFQKQKQPKQSQQPQSNLKQQDKHQFKNPYFYYEQNQDMNELSDFESRNEKYILQKFNFRLQ